MNYWIDTNRYFTPGDRDSFPLIHMTQRWDVLQSILKEGLKPSYCTENITNNKETKSACFPMISMSNVNKDFAITYQKSYGTYGIILDKVWGEINDFNPVLYLERSSDLTNEIIDNFKHITAVSTRQIKDAINGNTTDYKSLLTRQILKIFAHSKNYDGELVRDQTLMSARYPYGMEREWRKIIRDHNVPYFLSGEDMNNKRTYNQLMDNIRVDYELDHLKGVICEDYNHADVIKEIVCEKFKLDSFPREIKIEVNRTRHVPDE